MANFVDAADALLVRHIPVEHIMSLSRRQVHVLTPFAKVRGKKITYPKEMAAKNSKEKKE